MALTAIQCGGSGFTSYAVEDQGPGQPGSGAAGYYPICTGSHWLPVVVSDAEVNFPPWQITTAEGVLLGVGIIASWAVAWGIRLCAELVLS